MRPTVWAMLMCLVLTPWARAATFDCDKASTSVEKVICSDTRLTNLDDQLGRQYKDVLAASSNGGALKAKQKAWLSSRNQCKDSDCIMKAYDDRIRVLNAMSAPAKSSGSPPAVVANLDGKRVQIGGYVVPLDFDATRVLSAVHFGLPQKPPCGVSSFNPEPSGCTM